MECHEEQTGEKVGRKISQELTQFDPRSHPRHLVGKRTAQKWDVIKDITKDSQVNSRFPYRWSPASLTVTISFYFLSNKNNKK